MSASGMTFAEHDGPGLDCADGYGLYGDAVLLGGGVLVGVVDEGRSEKANIARGGLQPRSRSLCLTVHRWGLTLVCMVGGMAVNVCGE